MDDVRWNDWNLEHATRHGVTIREIESLIIRGSRGFPRPWGDGKWLIEGRGQGGRCISVIFVRDEDDTIYVIHAMPVTMRRRR